jgi:hypothetical protein
MAPAYCLLEVKNRLFAFNGISATTNNERKKKGYQGLAYCR